VAGSLNKTPEKKIRGIKTKEEQLTLRISSMAGYAQLGEDAEKEGKYPNSLR